MENLKADEIIDGMLEKGIKDIDAIAVSAGMADQGVGKLIKDHRVKSLITTHIKLNLIAKIRCFGELAIEVRKEPLQKESVVVEQA